ncbi:MAG: hypothetical protein EPN48_00635 [Microbacteriaceae bacterium]|nr:MAG: hypothetical protein EPN48_00635 [Microbacteriaceae bacterium]
MRVEFSEEADDKLDFYEQTDRQLYDAFFDVIDLIANDSSEVFLRRHYLRPPGAYAVEVVVRARSTNDVYYLFWEEEPGGVAFIKAVATTHTRLS